MAPIEEIPSLDLDRSNKGASKQRRDQINAEIAIMRDLLPLPESSRQRLSQLQIMSLSCVYVRKCNILHKLFRSKSQENLPDSADFFQALSGFVLVTTREGKLLYISENVTDYLGHSMVDMKTQGDSLYDIVDKRDHRTVEAQLSQATLPTGGLAQAGSPTRPMCSRNNGKSMAPSHRGTDDVSFFCRMNISRTLKRQSGFGDVKVMHVRGHFINARSNEGEEPFENHCVFMATCSPLITPDLKETLTQGNTMVFKSVHKLDMTFVEITRNGEHHLGCSSEDLVGKSWYSILHPEDIMQAKDKHVQLIHANHEIGLMVTLRMLRSDGTSFWVNSVLQVRQASLPQTEDAYIVCSSQIIDENEAYQIKLQAHMFSVYPSHVHELWGNRISSMTSPGAERHMQPTPGHMVPLPSHHWVQQEGNCPVPVRVYHQGATSTAGSNGAVLGYSAGAGHHHPRMLPSYQQAAPGMYAAAHQNHRAHVAGIAPAGHQAFGQQDQLKAMLKRKIQGEQKHQVDDCKPSKMPRVDAHTQHTRKQYGKEDYSNMTRMTSATFLNGFQVGYNMTSPMHGIVPREGRNVQVMQVMQPANFNFGQRNVAPAAVKDNRPQFSPMTGMTRNQGMVHSEQVVPDVNVPESFLTPDPSPSSSPQPSTRTFVKTEPVDQSMQGKNGSVSILQALEKLAAMPHQRREENRMSALPTKSAAVEPAPTGTAVVHMKKKELPIFDAFDIDNFFDTLEPSADNSKESPRLEEIQVKQEIEHEISAPSFDADMDSPVYKTEIFSPASTVPSSSPRHGASPLASPARFASAQVKLERTFQEVMSSCEDIPARLNSAKPGFSADPLFGLTHFESNTKQQSPSRFEQQMQMSPTENLSAAKEDTIDDIFSYFCGKETDAIHQPSPIQQKTAMNSVVQQEVQLQSSNDHFPRKLQQHQASSFDSIASPCMFEETLSPLFLQSEEYSPQHSQGLSSAKQQSSVGQLSPVSHTSSPLTDLSGDLLDEGTTFTFDLSYGLCGMHEEKKSSKQVQQVKEQDVPVISDDLDFILDALAPSNDSFEMIKHG